MPKRVAVVFPEANLDAVEKFRRRHDPLGNLVAGHITIAYPFSGERDTESLLRDIERAVSDVPVFAVSCGHPSSADDEYVFLLVGEGARSVQLLHERMYAGPLAEVEKPRSFIPHMTIGRASDRAALEAALTEAAASGLALSGVARHVSVYRVDEDGRREVEFQVPLHGTA